MTDHKRRKSSKSRKDQDGKELEGKREPTKRESAAIAAARESLAHRPARAAFEEASDSTPGLLNLDCPHSDREGLPYLVSDTLGTASNDFATSSLLHLSNITSRRGQTSVEGLNASLALIGAIAPENELEAALAAQMAATHELSMEMLRRAKGADARDAMRDYGNLATKLTRTFTAQMKQLSDWRRGGEQVVRHVHVYEGGRAVVAETVNVGARNAEIIGQPHALGTALPGADAQGNGLPIASREGKEALPDARRRAR